MIPAAPYHLPVNRCIVPCGIPRCIASAAIPTVPTSGSSSVGKVRQGSSKIPLELIPQTIALVKNILVHIGILQYNIFVHMSQFSDCYTLLHSNSGFFPLMRDVGASATMVNPSYH